MLHGMDSKGNYAALKKVTPWSWRS